MLGGVVDQQHDPLMLGPGVDPADEPQVGRERLLQPAASDDRADLDPTLALARQAVRLGTDDPFLPRFRMTLGMAE
jgi:hypothetical protein